MKSFRPLSAVGQLAAHLREEIRSGRLEGWMPGVARLVRELGVGIKTVVAALEILKREGLLEASGKRRRNRIVAMDTGKRTGLRIRILLYEKSDAHDEHTLEWQLGGECPSVVGQEVCHWVCHCLSAAEKVGSDSAWSG